MTADQHEREMLEVITERDEAQDMADRLAARLAEVLGQPDAIGEHSSAHDPWQAALDLVPLPADDAVDRDPVFRLTDEEADVLADPTDPREVAHIECDCVPDLGPSHCHLCSTRAGWEMPWAEAHPATVTAEQRDALARVFLAERSGVDQVDFYEHQQDRYPERGPSPLWVAAQAAADRGLAALGIEVQR